MTFLNMGGCCCSSRKAQLQGTPVYYCCQPVSEDQGTFPCNHSAPGIPAGLLLGLNLDTSTPDTYQPPPVPISFNVLFGRPQSPLGILRSHVAECGAAEQLPECKLSSETAEVDGFDTSASQKETNKSERKTLADILLASPVKSDAENLKSNEQDELVNQEEDCCPICIEVYDAENPQIVTNCEHAFHLSCILEWMERSDSCPVCDKELILDYTIEQL